MADCIRSQLCNSQILYHSILDRVFRALSLRSHMEFKSFSEAKRCDSPWDSPPALSLHLCLSLSSLFLLILFPPALLLHSRVMVRTLSSKPISFSMFSHFYPIMACSEVSKATWHFYWGLIKDLWFNPCNLIEISHDCEALALCVGKINYCNPCLLLQQIRVKGLCISLNINALHLLGNEDAMQEM